MMNANATKPWDEITARDVTDTHRRYGYRCGCSLAWPATLGQGRDREPDAERAGTGKAKAGQASLQRPNLLRLRNPKTILQLPQSQRYRNRLRK